MGNTTSQQGGKQDAVLPPGSGANEAAGPASPQECPVKEYKNPAVYNVYGQRINDPNAPANKSPLSSLRNTDVLDPRNNMPLEPNQLPCPGQRKPLTTERVASNIPKGGTDGTWLFPSPQMVFNGACHASMHAACLCAWSHAHAIGMQPVLLGQQSIGNCLGVVLWSVQWPERCHLLGFSSVVASVPHATCLAVLLAASSLILCWPLVRAALKRKGKGDDVTEDDMDGFIAAHNGRCRSAGARQQAVAAAACERASASFHAVRGGEGRSS
jgi:hypothetical protein